ncbi:MAG: DUF523 domain-containing protein [Acholeplasmatales bacterium]|nr:DUF523 domain-containing protein [Acholeplasmatales bacterium]
MKEKLLISSCLLGNNVKYNGKNNYVEGIYKLKDLYDLVIVCPEVMGGLSIPRIPSEIINDEVINKEKINVTKEFNKGKDIVLDLVKKYDIKKALLKDGSPSCGSTYIYDGTFTGKRIKSLGITSRFLKELNIKIYTENNWMELLK